MVGTTLDRYAFTVFCLDSLFLLSIEMLPYTVCVSYSNYLPVMKILECK